MQLERTMFNNPGLTLSDQIFHIVELFLKVMAAEACKRRIGLQSGALWTRMRRLQQRFMALYAQWKAGTLPSPRSSAGPAVEKGCNRGGRGGTQRKEVEPGVAMSVCPASILPRGVAWMRKLLPLSAATLASSLEPLFGGHPEIQGFISEVPQAGRVLRPMCRMVGLKVPEWLALPRRKKDTSPRPSPQSGEGEVKERSRRRTPREVAKAAIERSLRTGKPIDPTKIGAVAYGYVLHWPRDGNCPPPEVGYGGRSFPRTPKDYVRPKDWE
jgi:hypothetical protein